MNHKVQTRRGLRFAAVLLTVLAITPGGILAEPTGLQAAEPIGLQAALAVENALVEVIAKAEKSVVAVAQYRAYRVGKKPTELRRDPFVPGLQRAPLPLREATDPDFVPTEYGAGVVIDRQGLIVTNFHVLGRDNEDYEVQHWIVTADKKSRRAKIKAADPRSDLAVLEIEASDLQPITLGDGAKVKKGQFVVALGNPYAIARDGQASASHGIVSNLSRKAGVEPAKGEARTETKPTLHHYGTLIQTDAKLNLGTSGGALVNLHGELIGLVTSAAAGAGYEQAAGYAIPVDETFRRVLKTLKDGREVDYGFLGVSPQGIDEYHPPMTAGMRINAVVPGTAAARAGLKVDDIITHVDEQAIHDADELFLLVGRMPAATQVQMTILRDDRTAKIPVTLTKYPISERRVVTARPADSWRGVRVDFVTAQPKFRELSRVSRIPEDPCVFVIEVEPESAAQRAGIASGMYITHLGDVRVDSPTTFAAATAKQTGSTTVRVLEEHKLEDPSFAPYEFKPKTFTIPAK